MLRALAYQARSDQSWVNGGKLNANDLELLLARAGEMKSPYLLSGAGWEALLRIIRIGKERGIEIRLLTSPYVPRYRESCKNYDWQRQAFLASLDPGVQFLDLSTAIEDLECFADLRHLNRDGSLRLLEILVERRFFEDSAVNGGLKPVE